MVEFSIITINYNNRDGLQKTIDSVIGQTWKNYEWIIIDGGSIDGSEELIELYQDYFVYWCSEPDKGVYNAMNKGVKCANGKYLLFLNSGDTLYDKNVLQKINDLHSKADIISGQVERMDNHELLHQQYKENLFRQLFMDTIGHQGAFINSQLFNKYPYDESLHVAADWKFWIQTIVLGEARVEITNIVVAKQDMTGISGGQNIEGNSLQELERYKIKEELFPDLLRTGLDDYKRALDSPYTKYENMLYAKSRVLYSIGWRLLRILSKF